MQINRCRTALLVSAIALATAAPASARLSAGAGRAAIAIVPEMLPVDGFGAVLDPLQARVLVLADGASRVAIAVVDQTSIGGDAVAEMKRIVAAATGSDPANVLICASHTFSAPHYFGNRAPSGMSLAADEQRRGAAYHAAVMAAVTGAAQDAARAMRPARLGFGAGASDVNVSRNVPMAEGWWLGANDAGPSDKQLSVVRIESEDRRPLAVLVNYAVQSSVMDHAVGDGGVKGVTADLAGATVAHVERQYGGGTVSLFLTGAAGDQMPDYVARRNVYDRDGKLHIADLGERGYPLVEVQGERLGAEAVRVSQGIMPGAETAALRVVAGSVSLDGQERPRELGQIKPSRTYVYTVAGKVDAPYWLLRIGDVALVGVQAELSAATGQAIKRRSPFAHTMVVTMVNGAAKYMPEADGYRKHSYQAMNSSFGPGSAELFAARIVEALAALRAGKR